MSQLVIKADQDRIGEHVTVAEYMGAMNGDFRAIVALTTKLLWNSEAGDYYDIEEAKKIVAKLKVNQLMELVKAITSAVDQVAVPNESGDAYEQG